MGEMAARGEWATRRKRAAKLETVARGEKAGRRTGRLDGRGGVDGIGRFAEEDG